MFPTADLKDELARLLERDRLHSLLVQAHPMLADRIEIDDARPLLKIPKDGGGAIVLWKGDLDGIVRWRMTVPNGARMKTFEPASIEELPGLVADELGIES